MAKVKVARSSYSGSSSVLKEVRYKVAKSAHVPSNISKAYSITPDARSGKLIIEKKSGK